MEDPSPLPRVPTPPPVAGPSNPRGSTSGDTSSRDSELALRLQSMYQEVTEENALLRTLHAEFQEDVETRMSELFAENSLLREEAAAARSREVRFLEVSVVFHDRDNYPSLGYLSGKPLRSPCRGDAG